MRASIGRDKLQHIYDRHAEDFGLPGSKNTDQLEKLNHAIASHLTDVDTLLVEGHYRGVSPDLHYNTRSQIVVVMDKRQNVIAAYKASPAQASYILSIGRLS